MRSCVEDCGEFKEWENADDYRGTETGEGDVDDNGGEIQTWGGDGSFEQFSADGHAILLVWKWWMQDDFTSRKWWRHGWTWWCEETQNGKNEEQTKIWQGWRNTNLRRWQFWAVQCGWPCYIACVIMVNAGWFYFGEMGVAWLNLTMWRNTKR